MENREPLRLEGDIGCIPPTGETFRDFETEMVALNLVGDPVGAPPVGRMTLELTFQGSPSATEQTSWSGVKGLFK